MRPVAAPGTATNPPYECAAAVTIAPPRQWGTLGGIKGADCASYSAGAQSDMSDQPPEDLGARAVLLLVAAAMVVLALITGVLAIAC
ncbi:MAG: hypothetical protein ACREIR_01730 [Geminicoccaceae bacterium]